jgi:hypothetical protein
MGPNKAVHLIFLCGGLILFFLIYKTGDWIWGYFARNPSEFVIDGIAIALALGVGIALYRNEPVTRSTERIGVTSTAVPTKKTSSAM